VVNTCRSAIRVLKDDLKTGACQPMVCRQCKKMLCMDDDQSDADAYRSRFVWKSSFSTSCPFDALGLWKDEVYHCDLCDGDPRCVNLCSTGAIRILDNCGKNDEGRTTKDD
jgi:ferredoxin